uniref:Uncharacterized protein n=1 Tax=Lactuca sativa TaxID=4236 RepID=A0A9R1XU73_LACSA|nr:hypothetical protein LSAT_V11C100029070 [Lactuca sativa]
MLTSKTNYATYLVYKIGYMSHGLDFTEKTLGYGKWSPPTHRKSVVTSRHAKKGKKTLSLGVDSASPRRDSASRSGIRVEESEWTRRVLRVDSASSLKMRRNSTSGMNNSSSRMKMGMNSASWMKIALCSASLFLDSASQVA